MAKDPKDKAENRRRRAREKFAQIQIRIRAQEKVVRGLEKTGKVVAWHDATRQLEKLKKDRQAILKEMQ